MNKILIIALTSSLLQAIDQPRMPKGLPARTRAELASAAFQAAGTRPANNVEAAQAVGSSPRVLNQAKQADQVDAVRDRLRAKLASRQAAKDK